MRCKYCNCLLEKCDNGVCRWCGKDNNIGFTSKDTNNVNFNMNHEHIKNEEFTTTADDLDNQLMKDYIGPNYQNLIQGGFSLPAFLFGTYYFCYRKFFSFGIILFFIEFFCGYIGVVIAHLISGFMFKSSYIAYAKTKIEQYRNFYSNYSYQQLSELCKEKGGVNPKFLIFPVIISIMMIVTALLFFLPL